MIIPVLQQNVFIIIVGSLSPLLLLITKHSWHFLTKTSTHRGFSIATVDYQRVDWMMFTCSAIHFFVHSIGFGNWGWWLSWSRLGTRQLMPAIWMRGMHGVWGVLDFQISGQDAKQFSLSGLPSATKTRKDPNLFTMRGISWDHIGSDIGYIGQQKHQVPFPP